MGERGFVGCWRRFKVVNPRIYLYDIEKYERRCNVHATPDYIHVFFAFAKSQSFLSMPLYRSSDFPIFS